MANKVDGPYKTVETAAATIRFSGGVADDSSDSSSGEDETPDNQQLPAEVKSSKQSENRLPSQSGQKLDPGGENDQRLLSSKPTQHKTEVWEEFSNAQDSRIKDTRPTEAEISRASPPTAEIQHKDPNVHSKAANEPQKIPTMSSNDSGFSTWSTTTTEKAEEEESSVKPVGSPTNSKDESQESARYRKQLERMKSERFNPFDSSELEAQDPFPQLDDVLTRPSNSQLPHRHDQPPERPRTLSTDTYPDEDPFLAPSTRQRFQDDSLITNAELGITEDHFAQPEGHFGLSTLEELELAIQNCKQLILQTPTHTERMKNLVGKLVQLRLKLAEAKEGPKEEDPEVKLVVGHQFLKRQSKSSKHYCEKCNSVIWGVLQYWYKCQGCGFSCHDKCLNLITRTCACSKVKENPHYILSICPEKGLASQSYRCYECRTQISNQAGYGEPRQCDYTGHYYCEQCHWNDYMVIPARVLHNWDFDQKKVCRASKQFLKLMPQRAVLRLQDINPMLFNFVEELNQVKKLREEVLIMKKYFMSCKGALDSKLLLQLKDRQHFVETSDMYSLQDLLDISNDVLLPKLAKIHASFAQHIKTDCRLCQGKGYICELCEETEVLFPFDNIAIVCSSCSTVLHRHCFMRRNQKCPKCQRLSQRTSPLKAGTTDVVPDSDHRGQFGVRIEAR